MEVGDIEGMEEFYRSNRRLVGYILHDMISGKNRYPDVFKSKNLQFLLYMLEKEELFSILLARNSKYLCNNMDELCNLIRENKPIYNALKRDPSLSLRGRVTREYLELFKDVREWCNPSIIDMNCYEEYVKILEDYRGVWSKRYNESLLIYIAQSPSIEIFKRISNVLNIQHDDRMFNIVIYRSTIPEILDVIGTNYYAISEKQYGYFYNMSKVRYMSINIIRYMYSIRRPTKDTFEKMIFIALHVKRYDIYEYLVSIAPYDCDIIPRIIQYISINVLEIYIKYMKLARLDINNIWKKVVKDENLEFAMWLYKNSYKTTIPLELGDGECSEYIRNKNRCNVM